MYISDVFNVWSLQIILCVTDKSTLLNITVPAQQVSATKSVSISATKDTLSSFTITKLCLNNTKATGPRDANNTRCVTDSVTAHDGPNATNVTVTIGEHKQTTVGKLSTWLTCINTCIICIEVVSGRERIWEANLHMYVVWNVGI